MSTVAQLLKSKQRHEIHSIDSEEPVLEAIRQMAEHGIGALLVMQGSRLAGIISERDYARKVILMGRSSSETPVWQIMSSPVISVRPEQHIQDCMQLMTEKRVRHLPVVRDQQVVGVLSIGDLVRALLNEQQQTIVQLESYIHS
ncbi:MAG: CBS domain-containing protein [Steroidobacteraceae bacterium]